ncbi:MAG: hypothetical protein JSS49_26845, partial [Planctomycetes bacterium]|nr:hypothetical protein [Planctomycetota bacterium]
MQISKWLWNWLESRRHRHPPQTPLDHAARLTLRKLEERQVLSVSAVFSAGVLSVGIDNSVASDPGHIDSTNNVTLSVDASGDVLVNGHTIDNGAGGNLLAHGVTSIKISDFNTTANSIDLSGVNATDFDVLTSLSVDAGGESDVVTFDSIAGLNDITLLNVETIHIGTDVISTVNPDTVYVDDSWAGATVGTLIVDANSWAAGNQYAIYGTTGFSSIQEGIDAVAEGGTVDVAAGTYAEAVTIDKSLTLEGESTDAADVLIDYAGGNVVTIASTASDVSILNLTAENGTNGFDASGITLALSFQNVHALNNSGDGFHVQSIQSVSFTDVEATGNGGAGLDIATVLTDLTLFNVNASGNLGDGVSITEVYGVTSLTDVSANHNAFHGVSLINLIGVGSVSGGEAQNNGLDGLHVGFVDTLTVDGGIYSFNAGNGLGISSATSVTLSDVTAESNQTSGADVADTTSFEVVRGSYSTNVDNGIFVFTAGSVSLTDVDASNNQAGGVWVNDGGASIVVSGGTFNDNLATHGLTLFTTDPSGTVMISNGVIADGNAAYGIVVGDASVVTITDVETSFNAFSGIIVVSSGDVSLTNVTADSNVLDGVVISSAGSVVISGGSFTNSVGDSGLDGFGILITDVSGNVSMTDVTADANALGGLNVLDAASVNVSGGTFTNSTGYLGTGGVGITLSGILGTATLTDVTSQGNFGDGLQVLPDTLNSYPGADLLTINGGNFTGNGGEAIHAEANTIDLESNVVFDNTVSLIGSTAFSMEAGASLTGSQVSVTSDSVSIDAAATISATTVTIQQFSDIEIDLGATSDTPGGPLALSNVELNQITATTLIIGNVNSGSITVSSGVTPSHVGTLHLITGDAVLDENSTGADITVGSLAIESVHGIAAGTTLETVVSQLAFYNSTSGDVAIDNTGSLTISAIGSVLTSGNAAGAITISTHSPITFAANMTSVGTIAATTADNSPGNVDNITVDAGVTLESTSGDVVFQAGDRIVINDTSAVIADIGNVSLTSGFGDVDGDGSQTLDGSVIAGGTVTIDLSSVTGMATEGSAGSISAPNLQLLSSNGGSFVLTSAANNVTTLTADVDGAIQYQDADDVTLGSVATGITTTNDSVTIESGGAINVANSIDVGGGTLRMSAAGSVTESAGKTISAAAVGVTTSTGDITLDQNNVVGIFAASNAAVGGSVTFVDTVALSIGTVSADGSLFVGAVGISTTTGGNIQVEDSATITVDQSVNAATTGTVDLTATGPASDVVLNADVISGSGLLSLLADQNVTLNAGNLTTGTDVTVTAGRAINESGAGLITGNLLTTSSGTGTVLNNANLVTSFNATNTGTGAITFADQTAVLAVTGISQTGTGTVSVDNLGGQVNLTATVSAGVNDVNLTASTNIIQANLAIITAGLLTTSSLTGTNLSTATNLVTSFNATNTVSGDIRLLNSGALNVTGINETGGNIFISNSGALSTSGVIQDFTDGTSITLTADGGDLTIGAAVTGTLADTISLVTTTSGAVVINGTVSTGSGEIDATSAGGISQSGSFSTAGLLKTVSLGGTLLTGTNTIGSFTASNTAGGDVNLVNTGALDVTGISETGGNVSVQNAGTLTVSGSGINASGAGSVDLTATGGSSEINVNSDVISGAGTLSLNAGQDLTLNAGNLTTGGAIDLTAGNAIIELGAGLISSGLLTAISSTGTVLNNTNQVTSFHGSNSGTGDISLKTNATTLAVTGVSQTGTGSVSINNTGGRISLTGSISASVNNVVLISSTDIVQTSGAVITGGLLSTSSATGTDLGTAINAVSSFQATNSTSGNINLVNTGVLTINGISETGGDVSLTNSGNLTIGAGNDANATGITLTTGGNLTLNVTGAVTQAASDLIIAGGLQLLGSGNVVLDNANNVGTVAARVIGTIDYADVDELTVGIVGATSGITTGNGVTAGGTVTITAGGELTVDQGIDTSIGSDGLIAVSNAVLNAALTAGAGSITLNGGGQDLIINVDQTSNTTINYQAQRDIIIRATITAAGATSDILLTADSNGDHEGGIWIDESGGNDAMLHAGNDVTLHGSDLSTTVGSVDSIRIDSDGMNVQVLAGHDINLIANAAAPTGADIVIEGIQTAISGSITVDSAGSIQLLGNQVAGADVLFQDAVMLNGDVTLNAGGNVSFLDSLDGTHALLINASGATSFDGLTGSNATLLSLTTDAAGTTDLNGGTINATTVNFQDDVILSADTIITGTTATFGKSANADATANNRTLLVNGTSTVFQGTIGDTGVLASLTTDAAGTTDLNGGTINAATVSFQDDVILSADTVITGTTATFAQTVNADATANTRTLLVNGTSTVFQGAIGNTGVLASLTTDAAGTTDLNGGTINATTVNFQDDVILSADTVITGSTATFAQSVNADATANNRALLVNGTSTVFQGAIGNTGVLASLTTDAAGTTDLNGGMIDAITVDFQDDVILSTDTVITGSTATFAQSLNADATANNRTLLVNGTSTLFQGAIGNTGVLASLTTDAAGTTDLNGGTINATTVNFQDDVILSADTVITGSTATFAQSLNADATANNRILLVNGTSTVFQGAIGDTGVLASLTTDAAGTTSLNGGTINATTVNFQDDVILSADTIITGITATFAKTLNADAAANSRTLLVNGTSTVFQGAIGNTGVLASLTTDAAGTTDLNGGTIDATTVDFHDDVILSADTVIAGTTATFAQTVNADATGNNRTLLVNGTSTVFQGTIGNTGVLASLTTDAAGTTDLNGGTIDATTVDFQDDVILSADTVITGTTATFAKTVNADATGNNRTLLVNGTSTVFQGAIGNTGVLASLTTDATGTTDLNGGTINATTVNFQD